MSISRTCIILQALYCSVLYYSIVAPLTHLTQKGVTFKWITNCDVALKQLKCALSGALVLTYPDVSSNASPFVLQTDASAYGLGAVLEQNNHAIALL